MKIRFSLIEGGAHLHVHRSKSKTHLKNLLSQPKMTKKNKSHVNSYVC